MTAIYFGILVLFLVCCGAFVVELDTKRACHEVRGNTANLSAYSDEFNPALTSADEPLKE